MKSSFKIIMTTFYDIFPEPDKIWSQMICLWNNNCQIVSKLPLVSFIDMKITLWVYNWNLWSGLYRNMTDFSPSTYYSSKTCQVHNQMLEVITVIDSKQYYMWILRKAAYCRHKHRCIDQWNRTENPAKDINRNTHLELLPRCYKTHWKKKHSLW